MRITKQDKHEALVIITQMQQEIACHNPKYLEATSKVINEALLTPDIETRCWYDNLGEMVLARNTIQQLLDEITEDGILGGLKVTQRNDDRESLTVTWELSNGSAIKIGLKQFEFLSR